MPVPGADFTRPNPARIYDYLLGGHDNFGPDREMGDRLAAGVPALRSLVRQNRRFVLRSVTWMASRGTGQFVDCGCGLPATPSVHQTARATRPGARVAYLDNDPVVLSHARAMAGGDGLAVIAADVRDPGKVLEGPGLREVIDLDEPCGLLFGGTLSAMDSSTAQAAVAGFAERLAPGSAVAISCISYADPVLAREVAGVFAGATGGTWANHGREDIESFFTAGGLRVAHGRVMDVACWPACPVTGAQGAAAVLGGIGVLD